jgi:hypothetical protein
MHLSLAAEKIIVRAKVFGGLVRGAPELGLFELARDRANDPVAEFVLQIENRLDRSVEAVGPQVYSMS